MRHVRGIECEGTVSRVTCFGDTVCTICFPKHQDPPSVDRAVILKVADALEGWARFGDSVHSGKAYDAQPSGRKLTHWANQLRKAVANV